MTSGDWESIGKSFDQVPNMAVIKAVVCGVLIAAVAVTIGHSMDKLNRRIKKLEKGLEIERAVRERTQGR